MLIVQPKGRAWFPFNLALVTDEAAGDHGERLFVSHGCHAGASACRRAGFAVVVAPDPSDLAYLVEPTRRRAYDHRLRELVCERDDPALALQLGIPRSTASSWRRRNRTSVVSHPLVQTSDIELQAQVLTLQRRVAFLRAILALVFVLLRLSGFRLALERLSAEHKQSVLAAIERAVKAVPLRTALRVVGLSSSRYHAWRRLEHRCALEDRSSCPKLAPQQLTSDEVATMQQMVTADEYRHMPIRTLALHAARIGKLVAAPATWFRLIREKRWRRPRRRLYPKRPTEGVRASRPNEIWHVDATVIKLFDGTRTFLHAVIDNFSRKILAWKLCERLEPGTTCELLLEAGKALPQQAVPVCVYSDSGVENVNAQVDELLSLHPLRRVLAQVEVAFSNSLIEAWWRSLKNNWLFLHQLETLAGLNKLIAFYVDQHNRVMPHCAFKGQTPDEIYAGTGDLVPEELAERRRLARAARLEANRKLSCHACLPGQTSEARSVVPNSPIISSLTHLRTENSRMS